MDTTAPGSLRIDPGLALRGEPYRFAFPLGYAYLLLAFALWLAPLLGLQIGWPAAEHFALTAAGFMGCFVAGFLTTMLPNLLGAAKADTIEKLTLFALIAAGMAGLAARWTGILPWLCLAFALYVLAFALRRIPSADRRPPPPMVGAAIGILACAFASITTIAGADGWIAYASHQVLTQGSLALLVVAIGGFLVPRLAMRGRAEPACVSPGIGRPSAYLLHAGLALGFLATFAVEALALEHGSSAWWRAAFVARAAIAAFCLRRAFIPRRLPAYLHACQASFVLMILGFLLPAFHPLGLMAWHHMVFVGGFLWLTMIISARVATAHAGRGPALDRDLVGMALLAILLLTALAMRVGAEFATDARLLLLGTAAAAAIGGCCWWCWRYGRWVFAEVRPTT